MAARVGDYGGVGLGAWLSPMKHKLGAWLSLSLSLSLSYLVVCWGSAMDFGVWFVGDWWFFYFSLLAWWW